MCLDDIPEYMRQEFTLVMNECMEMYEKDLKILKDEAGTSGEFDYIEDDKKKKRAINNYANDKAREWLPMCLRTGMAIMMNAREWSRVLKELRSYPFEEFTWVAQEIEREVRKISPSGLRHTEPTEKSIHEVATDFEFETNHIKTLYNSDMWHTTAVADARYRITEGFSKPESRSVKRVNRYDSFCTYDKMTAASYLLSNIPISAVRDANRSRTGNSHIFTNPRGFYYFRPLTDDEKKLLTKVGNLIVRLSEISKHPYGLLLGHQCAFSQTTTLDKLIYTIELRTGPGAHEVYHMFYSKLGEKVLNGNKNLDIAIGDGKIESI
jgi:hypothetical protein